MSILSTRVWNPVTNNQISIEDSKWIHFNGSYGDIFCAASILGNSDALKNGFLVLSPLKNYDILRVFYSRSWIAKYVYLHNDNLSQAIRDQLILPYWRYHKFDISAFYGVNLPKNAIMTPLLTDNLSLAKLWAKGKISFTDAIECMLNAGIDTKPILPKYFNDSDFAKVKSILAGTHCKPKKSVLYNPVNHSNDSITFSDLNELKKMLVSNNISLTFNASQADSSFTKALSSISQTIEIPGHILPLVQSKFNCIAGTQGGALLVGQAFAKSSSVSLLTDNIHHAFLNRIQTLSASNNSFGFDFFKGTSYEHLRKSAGKKKNITIEGRGSFKGKNKLEFFNTIISLCR